MIQEGKDRSTDHCHFAILRFKIWNSKYYCASINPTNKFSRLLENQAMLDGALNKRTASESLAREASNNKVKKTSITNIISEAA